MTAIVLLIHAVSTLMMTGLIWFVQVAHYPLFAMVDRESFRRFESEHVRRTTWVVSPLMLAEALTAVGLTVLLRESPRGEWALAGLVPLVVIWVSTAVLQVPCHRKLEQGPDPGVVRRLVRTNWIRTVAWTVRGGIALGMLAA